MNAQTPVTPPTAAQHDKQSSFVRRMIDSHSVLGLGLAALIYIVSLTGAFSLFIPEITLWENTNVATGPSITPEVAAKAAENAEKRLKPGNEILNVILYAPNDFQPYATVRLNQRPDQKKDLESTDWVIDPATGALIDEIDAPYAHLIEDLHTVLHLPSPWGRYLVGLVGVVMFTLILSGIFAHPTIFKDAFKLRLDRNARMAWTDVHNRLSVWGLPFHLVLTFTGAFLGVAGITVSALAFAAYEGDAEKAISVINGPQAIKGAPPMLASPNYTAMLRNSDKSGRRFALMVANNPKDSGQTTSVIYAEDGILSTRSSDIYRNNGEFLEKFGGEGSAVGSRIFGAVQPLHYGTFGGYPIKLFYFVLALGLTYITSSGMMIWFKRKAQQGQPKRKTEAAWRGMTSGLTLSLSVGAVLAMSGADLPIAVICLSVWAIGLAAIYFTSEPVRWVRATWMLSSALLVLAIGINVMGNAPSEATSWAVNAIMAACAAGLGFAALRLNSLRRTVTVNTEGILQPAE